MSTKDPSDYESPRLTCNTSGITSIAQSAALSIQGDGGKCELSEGCDGDGFFDHDEVGPAEVAGWSNPSCNSTELI